MEICNENTWGTACDDNWDNSDAKVVCMQLGFSAAGLFNQLLKSNKTNYNAVAEIIPSAYSFH